MSVPYETPLTYIEGIGPVTERALQDINLFYVYDLIRAAAEQIHPGVANTHSLAQVRRWRAMAILLQVEAINHQWAEALVRAEVSSIEKLKGSSPTVLEQIFKDALEARIIPSVPSRDEIATILLDATTIHHTGGINGTVRDSAGQPLAEVEVRLGPARAATDARGRFRLIRVPLGRTHYLILKRKGFHVETIKNPALTSNNDLISVHLFTMRRTPDDPGVGERMSEYDGDTLPELAEFSFSTRQMDPATLRDRDIFVLHRFYANGTDAQLVSKYLDYEDGKFYALHYRVPSARLPPGTALRSTYRYQEGKFVPIKLTPRMLRRFKALRRMRKAFRGRPRPATLMEYDALRAEMAEFMRQEETR